MTESKGGVGTLGQVALSVADLDAAVDFYGEKLGLRLIGRFQPGLDFFDCGDTRVNQCCLELGIFCCRSCSKIHEQQVRRPGRWLVLVFGCLAGVQNRGGWPGGRSLDFLWISFSFFVVVVVFLIRCQVGRLGVQRVLLDLDGAAELVALAAGKGGGCHRSVAPATGAEGERNVAQRFKKASIS